jgi:hypothetical protein
MRALFIWTIIYPVEPRALDDGAARSAERSTTRRLGVSRELVEVYWSGLCGGTAVRFLQPHSAERLRLCGIDAEPESSYTASIKRLSDLTLGATLLSVTACGPNRCCADDAPCVSPRAEGRNGYSFLVCSTPDECALSDARVVAVQGDSTDDAPQQADTPEFIRRLLALSLSAVPTNGQCRHCRDGRWRRLAHALSLPIRDIALDAAYRVPH